MASCPSRNILFFLRSPFFWLNVVLVAISGPSPSLWQEVHLGEVSSGFLADCWFLQRPWWLSSVTDFLTGAEALSFYQAAAGIRFMMWSQLSRARSISNEAFVTALLPSLLSIKTALVLAWCVTCRTFHVTVRFDLLCLLNRRNGAVLNRRFPSIHVHLKARYKLITLYWMWDWAMVCYSRFSMVCYFKGNLL